MQDLEENLRELRDTQEQLLQSQKMEVVGPISKEAAERLEQGR